MKCDHCVLCFLALVMFCVCVFVGIFRGVGGGCFFFFLLNGACAELEEEFLYLEIFES